MGKIYMKIGAVVSYCENDHKFLEPCVKSLKKVCSNIVISYCERYLDGSEQNLDRLNQFLKDNPEVIAASFAHENAFSADPRSGHNFARIVGYEILRGITNKIMFVDTDEILDAESFKIWANQSNDIDILDHMNFKCFWYYRDTCWRALQTENCISLHNSKSLMVEDLNSAAERWFWYAKPNTKIGCCLLNGSPIAHHYSWVRTKDEMIKKVNGWGHQSDRDWNGLVNLCFSSEFTGKPRKELGWRTDIVHNYDYVHVEPYIP
jgi:hypothetical protein